MDNQQALWNFDDKVGNILGDLKANFLTAMYGWNLQDAYFNVRLIWMECDAKLDRATKEYPEQEEQDKKAKTMTEQQYAEFKISELENLRNSCKPGEFYPKLEKFYMLICFLMKKNGLYFRENHDPARAALRR